MLIPRDFRKPRNGPLNYVREKTKGLISDSNEFFRNSFENLRMWYEQNKVVFWATYVVSLIAYTYVFTSISFTNHTFPQAWTYSYPSYRTTIEGRWFSDLVLWLLGGAGVQSSQMYISVGLFIVNAILIAEMFGTKNRVETFFAAVFLSVYPAIFDRYSFPGSQITFVLADTFAILAVLVLSRHKPLKALIGAVPLFVLCFATYQPAVALAAFLVLAHCVLSILSTRDDTSSSPNKIPYTELGTAVGAIALGMVFYYASVKLTVSSLSHQRLHVNSHLEIMEQISRSFPEFVKYYTSGSDYLPAALTWLPLAVILLGALSIILLSWKGGLSSLLLVLAMLALMPCALRSASIINSQSFSGVGRIVYAYGFALLFFLVSIGKIKKLRTVLYSLILVFIYFSSVLATQETNKAYLKMIFDTNKINRIAIRIESIIPDLYADTRPLIVIGNLSMSEHHYKSFPNSGNQSQFNEETFISYRQKELLNFYFGRDVLTSPTIAQLEHAIQSSKGRRPWPAPESVYVADNIVIVLLEEYRPGIPITWPK